MELDEDREILRALVDAKRQNPTFGVSTYPGEEEGDLFSSLSRLEKAGKVRRAREDTTGIWWQAAE